MEDYQRAVERLEAFRLVAEHDVVVHGDRPETAEARAAEIGDAEALVLIRERTPVDEPLLERLPHLRLIVQTGRGLPHVDVDACTRRGIVVCNGSGTPYAAAEMTLALMLAATRNLVTDVESLRAGGWSTVMGRELNGRVLGIVGYGSIGALVGRYGSALGMRVVAWGREASLERALGDGVVAERDLDALCSAADVLSLHVRLTPETRGLITARHLSLMKPDALLVNTARAGVIERGALLAALAAGRPGAAAIDVFDEEPAVGDPLVADPAVLATPHLGYGTWETYEGFFAEAFAQVNAFAAGAPTGVVNPEVLDARRAAGGPGTRETG
jgi:D-3-phosphoglycerate dehydrogenase